MLKIKSERTRASLFPVSTTVTVAKYHKGVTRRARGGQTPVKLDLEMMWPYN